MLVALPNEKFSWKEEDFKALKDIDFLQQELNNKK